MADPMTAPASPPDLDALEARLLDAERADLLVEHGVRFTDIKWLIAAARERHGRMCVNCGRTVAASHPRHEPLPECVGPEGMAACTFDLTLNEAWQHWRQEAHAERQRAEQAVAERDALRAVLVDVRAVVAELVAVDRRRLSRVVADIDAALAPEQEAPDGR